MNAKETRIQKSTSLRNNTVSMIENYPNYNYGDNDMPFSYKIDQMVGILFNMTRYTYPELHNYFTVEEAAALCDMENSTGHSYDINPVQTLYSNFEFCSKYEALSDKWGVNEEQMLNKLNNLTAFQAYVVQTLTAKFWENNTGTFTMKQIADLFYIDYKEDGE